MKTKYKNLFDLTDKVAIVTGASKGIGASIAKAFAEFGANVVVSSRSQEGIEKVVSEITENGYNAIACVCHVGEDDQLKNLIETTINKYGRIDILVNNAGINPVFDRLENADEKLFNKLAILIEKGHVIGWFNGPMEFGPRALGGRSIIGDPRNKNMQTIMNLKIKIL